MLGGGGLQENKLPENRLESTGSKKIKEEDSQNGSNPAKERLVAYSIGKR